MKTYKVIFIVFLLFLLFLFFLFFTEEDESTINENEYLKHLQKNEVRVDNHYEKRNRSVKPTQHLYDKSTKAKIIHTELQELFHEGDYHAALQLLKDNTICSIASLGEEVINEMITGIGEELLRDKSGRLFFNQSLIFSNSSIKTIDDIYDSFTNNIEYCKEFVKDDYSTVFSYLLLGARSGDTNSMIALWSMEHPIYIYQKLQYKINESELEYLGLLDEEQKWNEVKIDFLYQAANLGDARAWVLLGDGLISKGILPPDMKEAYKYYYAASKYYQFPFLIDKLSILENYLTKDEIKQEKINGKNLFRQFN